MIRLSALCQTLACLLCLDLGFQVWAADEASAPTAAATAPAATERPNYHVQPSDVIVVDVVGERDLEHKELRVSSKGTISFPYLENEEIVVAELTTAEIARKLRELLMKDVFVDPQILVLVKEYKKRSVTVIGQVTKQGVVEFPSEQGMNVLEAIGYAGGFTAVANKGDITITRRGQQLKFDLKDWLKSSGKKKEEQPKLFTLEPGDLVFVPESIL